MMEWFSFDPEHGHCVLRQNLFLSVSLFSNDDKIAIDDYCYGNINSDVWQGRGS